MEEKNKSKSVEPFEEKNCPLIKKLIAAKKGVKIAIIKKSGLFNCKRNKFFMWFLNIDLCII
ncbi:MAG: hypothetical protein K5866_06110 [Treponema sp.]|nr:hypothetical protein [Treponema sp.]